MRIEPTHFIEVLKFGGNVFFGSICKIERLKKELTVSNKFPPISPTVAIFYICPKK